ncbi:tRNA nucleotidyltransferase (CCA-adding enzyme) [Abditibacterium utsteinense]|uniref:tRNA nucleotidyltransferase (CCA-adding enzyme) n=1 Tax=Abditibacterium utsteinense TaxID=1960156 RepID=A0A2S8SPR3_9BACT|nr:CCA tRNA nucleotidyltransferase [Abditibacterium utsteinense]PQV62774.1 tRNA nucleotidyltransferase (CCA-adding enzyme) [Abditibacterium utsteinense]
MNFETSPLEAKARQVARAAQQLGGRAYLVGGYVRDELLQMTPKDADIEVYGLEASILREMLSRLGRVDCVGESFRVYKLVWHAKVESGEKQRFELDVSLPRRDKKIGAGHKGFEVEGDPFATVEDAARRRDFTLNAILKDPLSGEILDPFGGKSDLEKRLLRAVDGAHFGEDSLRVLRAMQFAARFNFAIEAQTVQICRETPLSDLPKERVWAEWEKWLLKAKNPSVGLQAGAQIGVFARLFPYLETAIMRRGAEMEAALDGAAREKMGLPPEKQVALMLSTLGSFLGWRDTKQLLEDLNIQKMRGENGAFDVRTTVIKLVGVRKTPRDFYARHSEIEDKDFRFFAARVEPDLALRLSRARGDLEAACWFEENLRRLDVFAGPPAPFLLGRHLIEMGMKPGPQIGKIVERVYFLQLCGEVKSLEEAKQFANSTTVEAK